MKYEAGVKARLEEDENGDKEIKRNAKLAKSELNVQIAKLDGIIVGAEAEVERKQELYDASKFNMPFSLSAIDDADYDLQKAKAKLKGHQDDLKNRKNILKELF